MRFMGVVLLALGAAVASAEDRTIGLRINDVTWAEMVVTPYDDASKESREQTYKVYTHLMDFAGKEPITKGAGGQFTHHRGLFIGWRVTTVGDKKFDTWHMTDCYQQYAGENTSSADSKHAAFPFLVEWRGNDGTKILDEQRTIEAQPGPGGSRVFDFTSVLTAPEADVTLRGDSHHAGMQVRLANEVNEHQKDTVYILPEGAKRLENDEVSDAWWAVCNAKIGGKAYWVMHMTPPNNPGGIKHYSIRPYARFGAFFEPDVKKGESLTLTYRIVVSEQEIDAAKAAALYENYTKSMGH
jgi:hypothetical protein